MATLSGVNYGYAAAVPPTPIPVGQYNGMIRTFYDEITPAAALGLNDIIKFGPLFPANARIIGGWVKFEAQGGSCNLKIGNAVSSDAAEAADDDCLFDQDVSSAGITLLSAENLAKFGLTFASPVQLQGLVSVAGATAAKKIQVCIHYVLD